MTRAGDHAEDDEADRVTKPVDGVPRADEAADGPRGDHRLECVARRDAACDDEWFVRGDVGDERAQKHPRPHLEIHQQERGKGQSGRRPDQRHLLGREGHREAELCCGDVDRSEGDDGGQPGSRIQ